MNPWNSDIEEVKKRSLKPNDTFKFTCRMCGKCCRNRTDPVVLTGYDVYRVAQALNISVEEVVMNKTELTLGSQSNLPILYLKERLDGSCSLLRKGKCTVHQNKPVVCAIYPLGRVYSKDTIYYVTQPDTCGEEDGKEWTLQEWLDEFNIDNIQEETNAWTKIIMGLQNFTSNKRNKLTPEILTTITTYLYGNLDIHKPYAPQVEENIEKLKKEFKEKYHITLKFD